MELERQPLRQVRNAPERALWIGLSCATLLHASLIFAVARSSPRQLGERDGSTEAISVDFVDPTELGGAAAQPAASRQAMSPPPPPQAAPATPPAPSPQTPPAKAATPPEAPSPPTPPETPPAKAAAAPPEAPPPEAPAPEAPVPPEAPATPEKAPPPAHKAPAEKAPTPAAVASATPPSDLAKSAQSPPLEPERETPPPPAPRSPPVPHPTVEPAPKVKPNPKLSLQLDLPTNFAVPPTGLSTAAVRPPDITRSGENDEFGRRVIRALRQTMPAARGELGRVTVRFLLSPTGDLAEIQLVRPASDPILTQNIVFAVKQSSFPIPPKGATVSDRTFLVTYIYN
jgi:TonB family protein